MKPSSTTFVDPHQVLGHLVQSYGRELLDDPRRVEGLLRDYCPSRRREISALVAAQKEHVATEFITFQGQIPPSVLVARLARRLHEQVGLTEELSQWAVSCWAVALGIETPGDYQVQAFFAGKKVGPEVAVKVGSADVDLGKQPLKVADEPKGEKSN